VWLGNKIWLTLIQENIFLFVNERKARWNEKEQSIPTCISHPFINSQTEVHVKDLTKKVFKFFFLPSTKAVYLKNFMTQGGGVWYTLYYLNNIIEYYYWLNNIYLASIHIVQDKVKLISCLKGIMKTLTKMPKQKGKH